MLDCEVDSDPEFSITHLRVVGQTVSWTHAGVPHSATLGEQAMSVSTTPGLTLGLAQRAASLEPAELPDDVAELARQALLDWFGVTLAWQPRGRGR